VLGTSEQCIASNPSDMCVALAILDAVVHVRGLQGTRAIPFNDFHVLSGDTPKRETVLDHGELITAVELPAAPFAVRSHYLKVRDRTSRGEPITTILERAGLTVLEGEASAQLSAEKAQNFAFQSFGAQFCEVQVDEWLGRVRVTRWVGAYDPAGYLTRRRPAARCWAASSWGSAPPWSPTLKRRSGRPASGSTRSAGTISLPARSARDEELGKLKGFAALRCALREIREKAAMLFRDAPAVIRDEGIDALIIDQIEFAGGTVAEHLGLPFVSVAAALPANADPSVPPFNLLWPHRVGVAARLRNRVGNAALAWTFAGVLRAINRQRRAWGCPRPGTSMRCSRGWPRSRNCGDPAYRKRAVHMRASIEAADGRREVKVAGVLSKREVNFALARGLCGEAVTRSCFVGPDSRPLRHRPLLVQAKPALGHWSTDCQKRARRSGLGRERPAAAPYLTDGAQRQGWRSPRYSAYEVAVPSLAWRAAPLPRDRHAHSGQGGPAADDGPHRAAQRPPEIRLVQGLPDGVFL
jgi:hypothetical protein